MRAALLIEHIKLLEPVIVKSETGTETTSFIDKWSLRARQTYSGGDRENQNGDIVYTHTVDFEIRRFYDFDERYRVEWNGQQYRIICIERNRHNQSIKIKTEIVNE